jgi:hypothetical protein
VSSECVSIVVIVAVFLVMLAHGLIMDLQKQAISTTSVPPLLRGIVSRWYLFCASNQDKKEPHPCRTYHRYR